VMCATGCSSSSVSIAPVTLPGSYTISIQAVAAQQSTPINHSVQVVLNVSSGR
jgi:hypothetical protein